MSNNLTYLPTSIVHQMTRNKKADSSYKLRYKDKSYQLSVYKFSKIDIAKIYRVDGKAALYVGSFKHKDGEYDLHAESISIDDIKKILSESPFVAILGVNKGTDEEKRFVAVVSVAFKDMNQIDSIKRDTLLKFTSVKKVRDSQVNALYTWESKQLDTLTNEFGSKRISLGKLNKLAKKIITFFNLPMEKIHIVNETSRSARKLGVCRSIKDDITSQDPNFVVLNIFDSTFNTLIHEVAHLICHFKFNGIAPHGKEFSGVYAYLLSKVYKRPVDEIIKSMQKSGLNVTKFNGPTKELDLDLK